MRSVGGAALAGAFTSCAILLGFGVGPLVGAAGAAPAGGPMTFGGGVVEHSPTLYPIFWGDWTATTPLANTNCGSSSSPVDCTATSLRAQILKFYNGLSGSTYQGILTQYYDATGYISSQVTLPSPAGYLDPSVPTLFNGASVGTEIQKMATANSWNTSDVNNQFIVLPAPGTNYEGTSSFTATTTSGSAVLTHVSNFTNVAVGQGMSGTGIASGASVSALSTSADTITLSAAATASASGVAVTGQAFTTCGYHFSGGSGAGTFVGALIPYGPDASCAQAPYNLESTNVASHEYAEAATDPAIGTGWTGVNGEVADVCATGGIGPSQDEQLSFGYVQALWDNAGNMCSYSDTGKWGPYPPRVSSVSPASGAAGTKVTVSGANFVPGATTVKFGTNTATSVTVLNPDTLTVSSPSGSGEVDVTVSTSYGTSATGSADLYSYPQAGVLTLSVFQFATGTSGITDLHEPFILYEGAPSTNWSQSVDLTNGASATASSKLTLSGLAVNSNGSLSGLLVWDVDESGTSSYAITSGISCSTSSTFSQCFTPVTIPAGTQVLSFRLTRTFLSANGNYWWNAAIIIGGNQKNVGLIELPGGTTTIDPAGGVFNQTQYIGAPASCPATPQSNITWLSPWSGSSYAQYTGSLAANNTCTTTFTPLNLGGEVTGVNVKAPA